MFTWTLEPSLILGLAGQAIAYLACIGPLRYLFPGSSAVPGRQISRFLLGVLTLFIALVSPIGALADGYLLSAHMVQHLLITMIAPPLLLAGTPRWLLRPLIQPRFAFTLGRFLTQPLVAFLVFNVIFILWHVPAYYDLTLRNQYVHIFEHALFFLAATLTWWPVFSPLDELPRSSPGLQTLYLFFQALVQTILGAIITFSKEILYPTYASAPLVWGLSHHGDQEIAGLIMWIIGSLIFFAILTFNFLRWFSQDDREEDEYDLDPIRATVR